MQNKKEQQEEKDSISISRVSTHHSHTPKLPGNNLPKVLTARSNVSIPEPGPPPDGGVTAWTQAIMGHLVLFNTWGIVTSFGLFQTYYTTSPDLHFAPSAVSWIGSVQMLFHFGFGTVSGRALDGGYFYWAVIPGVLCVALGMILTSWCHVYWQFFLAQGVLMGVGCGLQFTPSMSLVTTYFAKRRNLAVAIVASGSSTGGLVYPAIVREVLPRLGFAWAVRIVGLVSLCVGVVYCSCLRPRLRPRKSGPFLELSAWRETPYALYCAGVFLVVWGQFFAFYYVGSFGLTHIHISTTTSITILMIMNAVGLFGRLIPSYLADRWFGPINTILPFALVTGILLYFWALVTNAAGLWTFSIIYGSLTSGFQGLFPAVMTSLTKDLRKVGTRNGMGFAVAGLAAFTGPPIAGALIQVSGGSYLAAQMWAGSVCVARALWCVCSPG